MTLRPFARQLGFTLLECMVAMLLASVLAFSLTRSTLDALGATGRIDEEANLTDHALDILSDLREITAYDSGALERITGRTVTSEILRSDGKHPLTVTISVTSDAGSSAVVATVTVTDAAGTSVTERRSLFAEAPVPGSVIDQASPAPQGG